jgi:hypothetical protein
MPNAPAPNVRTPVCPAPLNHPGRHRNVLCSMVTSTAARAPMGINGIEEELQDSGGTIIVVCSHASDKPRLAVDEPVDDYFPTNKSCMRWCFF